MVVLFVGRKLFPGMRSDIQIEFIFDTFQHRRGREATVFGHQRRQEDEEERIQKFWSLLRQELQGGKACLLPRLYPGMTFFWGKTANLC